MSQIPGRARSSKSATAWTEADQAELDVLIDEFVDVALDHVRSCAICSAGPWCGSLREALELVLEWRRARELRSIAVALRARQDLVDWQALRERAA